MEMDQVEVKKVAEAVQRVSDEIFGELGDLQLALVGGGVGEINLT